MTYGTGAGGGIFGAFMNGAMTMGNNALSARYSHDARQENYMYSEMAANASDARTRKLYQDLQSPSAIMGQLKTAGLSPALMYGGEMGGTIGQGAQGSGSAGLPTQVFGMSAAEAAQIGLTLAQTEKVKAETENVATNTDKQKAEIDKLVEETKNEQLKQVYNELNNTLTQMDVNLKGTYAEEQIKTELAKTAAETNNLKATLESIVAEGKIKRESADSIIEYYKNRVIDQTADILLKEAQTKLANANVVLTGEQCKQIIADIAFKEGIVDISRQKVHIDRDKLNAQIEQWAKENGLRNKEANIKLANVIADFIVGNGANGIRAIDALIPG